MKIATLIRCYHATEYLARVLRNYSWVDKILVMNYRFNSVAPITDDTQEIAKGFSNVEVEQGENLIQHEILNRGLEKLHDYDYVFISDADEFILPSEQREMITHLHRSGRESGFCMVKDYFYDAFHCMPQRQGYFLAITNPKTLRFTHIRSCQYDAARRKDFFFMVHHFGFALRPDRLAWKMHWESVEEKVDVAANIAKIQISNCMPPPELLDIIKE